MTDYPDFDLRGQTVRGNQTIIKKAHKVIVQTSPPSAITITPHQIPPPPLDFTGRKAELEDLLANFDKGATITGLQGMGGIGKTALALVLAENLKDRYPDGQIFIELKGTSENPLMPAEAMAQVIRAYHPTAQMPEDLSSLGGLYRSILSDKRTLLLFDNAANREQVELLLPPKSCAALITSRQKFTLPGLKARNMELLPRSDSRDLLLTISNRIGDQADNLVNLCGYLPIALRNAASLLAERVDVDVVEYAQKLKYAKTRLDLVDATFSLSYELLSPNLQKQWSMLSVLPADFDRTGAAAVWELDLDATADALSDLVKWSLLDFNPSGERYRLHDLARDFAGSRLEATPAAEAQQRHAEHYKNALSAFDELYMKGGSSVLAAMQLFDLEEANIMAGHAWAEKNLEANSSAAELCSSYPNAGVYVLDLRLLPWQKISWLESGMEAARRLKDRAAEGAHLGNLGLAYAALGDAKKAIEFYEQALVIDREIGDRRGEGNALGNLGNAYAALGDAKKAIEFYEQHLVIAREIGDRRGEGNALGNLGLAYAALGDAKKAIEFYEQHLVIAREIGDRRGEGNALFNLSLSLDKLGQRAEAIDCARSALKIYEQIESPNAEQVRRALVEWQK